MPRLIQNTLQPLYEMKKFKGIDNLATDDLRLDPGFVRVAENVDLDSEMMVRRRKGVLRQIVSGNAHSGWSDEDKLCFLVLNDDLVRLNTDWTTTTLLANVGPSKMNFVPIGGRVFFSNLLVNGYIESGVAHGFPENVRMERQRMVGGELIEYFNARLYSAQGGFIFRSIAGNPFEMDIERDHFYIGGPVTMLIGVSGPGREPGLYVSGGGKCAYLSNLEPSLEDAHYKPLLDVPCLPGSAVAIERMDVGRQGGLEGRCCIWSTVIGIFMGFAGGYVKDCTSEHYAVLDIEEGFSFIKYHLGYRQYVFIGQAPAEIAGNSGSAILSMLTGHGDANIT
jgi:hypothetical protein